MVQVIIKSVQCSATSKGSGQRCKRFAIRGGTVCVRHGGGAKQVRQKALERITIAQALATGDRRPPWAIIADAVHTADVLLLDVKMRVEGGEDLTPELTTKLVDALERAARLSKLQIDGKFVEAQTRERDLDAELVVGLFLRSIERVDLSEDQRWSLRRAMAAELQKLGHSEDAPPRPVRAITRSMDGAHRTVVDGDVVEDI